MYFSHSLKNGSSGSRQRSATSVMEVVVAIALLAAASAMLGGFVHQVKQGLRERELSVRCDWELTNARERIGSWPVDQLTTERIQQIPISESLSESVSDAHFSAAIQRIEKPGPAMQITLALECERYGQTIQPSVVTFWVALSSGREP